MGTLLEALVDEHKWEEFYKERTESKSLSKEEAQILRGYMDEKRYLKTAEALVRGEYTFGIPERSLISKGGSDRKRIIYRFGEDEVWILKHLAFLMHAYDGLFSPACYSFIKGRNAKTAVREILSIKDLSKKYCLKADIHDFFNSIPVERLCDRIDALIDDPRLKKVLKDYLCTDLACASGSGELIHGNRGAMAGTPLAPFLADLYLTDLDRHFTNLSVPYFRYADDILIFAEDLSSITELRDELTRYVYGEGLTLNDEKTMLLKPGDTLEFLGFRYDGGRIDISENTKRKIRNKIRRKAHALYRWRQKKGAAFESAALVMIRSFNRKFYDVNETGDFSWSRWFFPIVNTDTGFHEIDEYLIRYIRYLYKGRHYKGNYRVAYKDIKALGFRPLVNEFHRYRGSKK